MSTFWPIGNIFAEVEEAEEVEGPRYPITITDIDYENLDALLRIGSYPAIFFQFNDSSKPPTLEDAIKYLR